MYANHNEIEMQPAFKRRDLQTFSKTRVLVCSLQCAIETQACSKNSCLPSVASMEAISVLSPRFFFAIGAGAGLCAISSMDPKKRQFSKNKPTSFVLLNVESSQQHDCFLTIQPPKTGIRGIDACAKTLRASVSLHSPLLKSPET